MVVIVMAALSGLQGLWSNGHGFEFCFLPTCYSKLLFVSDCTRVVIDRVLLVDSRTPSKDEARTWLLVWINLLVVYYLARGRSIDIATYSRPSP